MVRSFNTKEMTWFNAQTEYRHIASPTEIERTINNDKKKTKILTLKVKNK